MVITYTSYPFQPHNELFLASGALSIIITTEKWGNILMSTEWPHFALDRYI